MGGPPQGWGYGGPPPKKGNPVVWIVLGVLAVAAAIGVIVVSSSDDDDETSTGGSGTSTEQTGAGAPEDTFRAFAAAYSDADCETLDELTTADFKEDFFASSEEDFAEDCREAEDDDEFDQVIVEDATVTSETSDWAEIEATVVVGGDPESSHVELVNVGGRWRIDSISSDPIEDEGPDTTY